MPVFLITQAAEFLTTEDGNNLIMEQLGPGGVPPFLFFHEFGFGF